MAKSSTASFGYTISGDGFSAVSYASSVTNAASDGIDNITLQAGNNTLAVPTGQNVVGLVPPSNSANAKIVKGINGDTGVSGWTNQPIMLPVNNATTIVINSVGTERVQVFWG